MLWRGTSRCTIWKSVDGSKGSVIRTVDTGYLLFYEKRLSASHSTNPVRAAPNDK